MNISIGITYGLGITMDTFGNATFNNVLFGKNNSTSIYFRQVETGGKYTFDDDINDIKLIQDKR